MSQINKDMSPRERDSLDKAERVDQRRISSPLRYSLGLMVESRVEQDCLVNKGDEEKELFGSYVPPLTAYLRWGMTPVDETKSLEEGKANYQYGWTLGLSGLQTGHEGIAASTWDNPEGIKNLVELLEDRESLLVLATLAFPSAMESAFKNLSVYKILNKYGDPFENTNSRAVQKKLSEAIRKTLKSNQTNINSAFFFLSPIVLSFDLNDLNWRSIFLSFTQAQRARHKAETFRRICEKTGFHVIEDTGWLRRHFEYSLTPLSEADWLEVFRILGPSVFGSQRLG